MRKHRSAVSSQTRRIVCKIINRGSAAQGYVNCNLVTMPWPVLHKAFLLNLRASAGRTNPRPNGRRDLTQPNIYYLQSTHSSSSLTDYWES